MTRGMICHALFVLGWQPGEGQCHHQSNQNCRIRGAERVQHKILDLVKEKLKMKKKFSKAWDHCPSFRLFRGMTLKTWKRKPGKEDFLRFFFSFSPLRFSAEFG